MVDRSELLPWSLFELSISDLEALEYLSNDSILRSLTPHEIDSLRRGLISGNKVALSLRSSNRNRYHGLCVFGLESPSPVPDKAIAMSVLSLATYPVSAGWSDVLDRNHLESALIEELRRFCRTHGFTRVVCYVPDDRQTLALLARHGFTVESVITSDATRIYGLSLHLPSTYTGDPYDGRHLLNWIAERLRLSPQNTDDTSSDCFLRMDALNSDLVGTPLGSSRLPVKLSLHTERARGGSAYLRIQFGIMDSFESQFELSIDDLREIAGVAMLDMSFWPPPEDGASIAVEIRRDLYDRFEVNRQNAYFDSGSYGTLLERAIGRGLHPYIFFVDFATSATNPRLIGLGKVRQVDRGSPDDLWERYGELSSWSDADMFGKLVRRYLRRSGARSAAQR